MRNELVEILVEEGGLDREYTERIITQQMSELLYSQKYRSEFSNVALHFACNCFDCFDQSVSSASGTKNLARRAAVAGLLVMGDPAGFKRNVVPNKSHTFFV